MEFTYQKKLKDCESLILDFIEKINNENGSDDINYYSANSITLQKFFEWITIQEVNVEVELNENKYKCERCGIDFTRRGIKRNIKYCLECAKSKNTVRSRKKATDRTKTSNYLFS